VTVTPQTPAEVWASGAAYEPYVGRWSRLVAREFLAWLAVAPGADWLDVGCGTGALTEAILAGAAPARVRAADASAGYVAYARARTPDARAAFAAADARALPWAAAGADAVVSGLVLNFVPEPALALAEMARVARPGAVVAAYVWDYAEGMQFMRHFWDAAAALDPAAAALDEGRRFPLCRPAALEALWRGAGLRGVAGRALAVPTRFRDFDDLWAPFLGGQGPAPSYATSLDPDRRARLRERIRAGLPVAADGAIALEARAWAVRGVRP
jgi:SAM-dependent methyltransferase